MTRAMESVLGIPISPVVSRPVAALYQCPGRVAVQGLRIKT
jgi:hypothetical protein